MGKTPETSPDQREREAKWSVSKLRYGAKSRGGTYRTVGGGPVDHRIGSGSVGGEDFGPW